MSGALSPSPKRRAVIGAAVLAAAASALGVVLTTRVPVAPAPAPAAPSAPAATPAPAALSASAAGTTAPPRGRAITPEITSAEDDDVELHVFSFRVAEARFDVVDLGMGRDLEGALARTAASWRSTAAISRRARRPKGWCSPRAGRCLPSFPRSAAGCSWSAAGAPRSWTRRVSLRPRKLILPSRPGRGWWSGAPSTSAATTGARPRGRRCA